MVTRTLDPERLRPTAALLAVEIAVGATIDTIAATPTGHDRATLDVLVRLGTAPGGHLRAVELSRQLLRSPSHVSRLLDRIEAAGLVRRLPDPADRRASLVELTAAGRTVVADFGPRLDAVLDDIIYDVLSTDEIETLVGLLQRVEKAARDCRSGPISD